ncbi:MAG: hypothetical protein NVS4B1_32150 [Ktedonobacteraceae bacterium]
MREIKILISHNAAEESLAEAWKKLLETISLKAIEVWFSSDTSPLGGMKIGEEWRGDLYERLKECNLVLALQTPVSAGKPWIMWECGVASGVGKERGIIPIVYGMERGGLPNPLNTYQMYRGDEKEQVRQVCERLIQEVGLTSTRPYAKQLTTYMSAVKLHLSLTSAVPPPVNISQANITLWTNRINELVQAGRISELNGRRKQMYASLGKPPLVPALHDLLSQLFLQNNNYKETLEETDYALKLSFNDIHLLHRKALALVGLHDLDEAKNIITRIVELDAHMKVDTEVASLLGRIYREQWQVSHSDDDLDAAIDAYYRAYQADPSSYYAGVNVIGLALAKGSTTLVSKVADEVLKLCEREQRQPRVSFWVDFTAGEVNLALGNSEQAFVEYQKGLSRDPKPGPFERESAAKGVMRMANVKKISDDVVKKIQALLG